MRTRKRDHVRVEYNYFEKQFHNFLTYVITFWQCSLWLCSLHSKRSGEIDEDFQCSMQNPHGTDFAEEKLVYQHVAHSALESSYERAMHARVG